MMDESPHGRSVVWRGLHLAGYEYARIGRRDAAWMLEGTAVFSYEHAPCILAYEIACTETWETRSCRVMGWVGEHRIEVAIEVSADRYRYESGDGRFTRELVVDDAGFVREYPGFWIAA